MQGEAATATVSDETWYELVPGGATMRLVRVMRTVGPLPVLDTSIRRLLRLADDAETSTGEVVAAIEADEAFAANVLRSANSGQYARPIQAATVRQAVTLVGRRAVRLQALEATPYGFLDRPPGCGRITRGQMHIHAVSVAALAAAIADRAGVPADTPHLAGLLHDLGKLVLPLAFDADTAEAISRRHPGGTARATAEREAFGVDHALVGGLMARYWDLPRDVTSAVALHHGGRSGHDVPEPATACVQLASATVDALTGQETDERLLAGALALLRLRAEDLDDLALAALHRDSRPNGQTLGSRIEEMERLSRIDDLTGIANRRSWQAAIRGRLEDGGGGSLLICDVDRFKEVNDRFGHRAGDLVLTEVARILDRHGLAGRLGGDEFAVWLDVEGDEAVAEAARIIEEVDAAFARRTREAPDVSISIGVAAAVTGIYELNALLERADRALYGAKHRGRHRVGRDADG